ncbi:hypothetical protein [Lysobacter sp. Hz 25]|uniref:hypothetical protein n=1 Tax=Lysobacter sp. Hz 25 TaxID=3383698 RepID=UPI0038D47157
MTGKAAKQIKISATGNGQRATGNGQRATVIDHCRSGVSRDHEPSMAAIFRCRRQIPSWAMVLALALALAVAVRRLALAKAIEDPEGGPQGCGPFFIGTGMSRMKNPCGAIERAGL